MDVWLPTHVYLKYHNGLFAGYVYSQAFGLAHDVPWHEAGLAQFLLKP